MNSHGTLGGVSTFFFLVLIAGLNAWNQNGGVECSCSNCEK
jgi:hypothetical protein